MPRPQPETITDGPLSWTLPSWKIEGFWRYVMSCSPRRPATAGRGSSSACARSRHEQGCLSVSLRYETRFEEQIAHVCHTRPLDPIGNECFASAQIHRCGGVPAVALR